MKFILIILGPLGLFFGCGGNNPEAQAKKVVLQSLKDPDSAKFGKFTQINEKSACLTVNARNSMGGYTGDQQVELVKYSDSKDWEVLGVDNYSHEMCIKIMEKLTKASKNKQ